MQDANNNWPLRRYSDVLLMFAEAENEVSGPTTDALDTVNKVIRRAFGVDMSIPSAHDVNPGISKEDFRDLIYEERLKEFALEGKHWYDLKRTDRLISTEGIAANKN